MAKQLSKLQMIYAGNYNEGWYVRMRDIDGDEMDEPLELGIGRQYNKRQAATLRGQAKRVARSLGYAVPATLAVEIR